MICERKRNTVELYSENENDFESDCETELYITNTYKESIKNEILEAKQRELDSWKENEVYIEVENKNQHCVSGKWVVKPKIVEGKQSVKARYVLRGFEENSDFRTDSPTCMKESVRILLAICATQKWTLHSIDFKTAFLQGKAINRDIYVKPPKEAQTTKLWKLRKTAYGLKDAPREWYIRLKNQIVQLNCKPSSIDNGLFMMHIDNELAGLLIVYVDDLLWSGNSSFETAVIQHLKQIFRVGCEQCSAFKYIGIQLHQDADFSITLTQDQYVKSIPTIPITSERQAQPDSIVDKSERKQLRSTVGKLNWASVSSRPDIGFHVGTINTSQKATVKDILKANKVIEHVQNTTSDIKFPVFSSINDIEIKVFTDASYANLPDGGSQGGHVVFLTDGVNSCPIAWQGKKVQRVVRSTLAAETLALVEGCETAYMTGRLLNEILTGKSDKYDKPIKCVVDNHSLFQSGNSTNTLEDKRLKVEMAILREMVDRNEIELSWCKGDQQLGNVLTKTGASGHSLREALHRGKL